MKVSVLLITYNHAPFIAQAIDSILMQETEYPFEVVIGDDFSTDNTRTIVIDYQKRYPDKIRLVLPDRNLGLGGNRMFLELLKNCQGSYVAFLDGDDYWTSDHKLQCQADFLDSHPEYSMCFHNTRVIYEDGIRTPYDFNPDNQKLVTGVEDLLSGNFIQTCSAMIRRDLFNDIPDWLYTIEPQDWAIYVLAAELGPIGYIPETMGVYRRHRGAIFFGLDRIQHLEKAVVFYELMSDKLPAKYDDVTKGELSRRYYDLAMEYERKLDFVRAAAYLSKCLEGREKWMEEFLPGIGARGPAVWDILRKRLRMYRHPFLYRAAIRLRPFAERLRNRANEVLTTRYLRRSEKNRKSAGSLAAYPNPVVASDQSHTGVITLEWTSKGTEAVEIRLGSPDGQLFCHGLSEGKTTTGNWVTDGMSFYLQDVSVGRPLTLSNTLDVVKISVIRPSKRVTIDHK